MNNVVACFIDFYKMLETKTVTERHWLRCMLFYFIFTKMNLLIRVIC